ncbi:MAG: hypothetical protein ABII18_12560 [bacterium]|nr:hypothetical protein [bacterium]
MKKVTIILFVAFSFMLIVSCGGDSKLPGEQTSTVSACEGDDCVNVETSDAGNFVLGYIEEGTPKDMPTLDVQLDGTKLLVTCAEDATTDGGLVSFNCKKGDYYDYFSVCIHGEVIYFSEADEDVWGTGCNAFAFYCDEYGFTMASSCSDSGSYLRTEENRYEIQDYVSDNVLHKIGY